MDAPWTFVEDHPKLTRLRELAEPVCESCGVDLYLIEFAGGSRRPVVRVMIDAIDGVSIDDCTKVSRSLSATLDVEDPFKHTYHLEVSSPGLNRPLRHIDDAAAVVGQTIKVETRRPVEDRRRFQGKLVQTETEALIVEIDGRPYRIPRRGGAQSALGLQFFAVWPQLKE